MHRLAFLSLLLLAAPVIAQDYENGTRFEEWYVAAPADEPVRSLAGDLDLPTEVEPGALVDVPGDKNAGYMVQVVKSGLIVNIAVRNVGEFKEVTAADGTKSLVFEYVGIAFSAPLDSPQVTVTRIQVVGGRTDIATGQILVKGALPPIVVVDPDKPPPVVVGKRFILVVEETEDRTPAFRDFVENLRLDAALNAKHDFRLTDDDEPALASWIAASASDRPALTIADANGKVLFTGKMPTTRADFDKILKEHGG